MVIVRLAGGLGNQMFQYATGYRLAFFNHSILKLDVTSYQRNPSRTFALSPFAISGEIANNDEIKAFNGYGRVRSVKLWLHQHLWYKSDWSWIRQTNPRFQPRVLEARGNIYLDGVWQSGKYFHDIASLIRSEFALREAAVGPNAEMAKKIAATTAVSVHIRRGDYVSNPATRAIHNVCSIDYYKRALELLTATEPQPYLFVFSDEPDWARKNLDFPYSTTIVDHNPPGQAHEDLRLMTLCRYHIIANSSFSWWGAWLCQHPDKMVFAPSRWFKNVEDYVISDIIPATWQLVAV